MQLFLSCIISSVLRLVPLSYIWGTCSLFLTLYQGSAPLTIMYNPLMGTIYIIFWFVFAAYSKGIAFSIGYLARFLPSIYAGWYMHASLSKNRSLKVLCAIVIPLFCIIAFIMHKNINGMAYLAVVPWTICFFIYTTHNFFLTCFFALVSAWALGDIIHMYLFNALSSQEYIALVPQALIERFILATTMYATCRLIGALVPCFCAYCKKCYMAYNK